MVWYDIEADLFIPDLREYHIIADFGDKRKGLCLCILWRDLTPWLDAQFVNQTETASQIQRLLGAVAPRAEGPYPLGATGEQELPGLEEPRVQDQVGLGGSTQEEFLKETKPTEERIKDD